MIYSSFSFMWCKSLFCTIYIFFFPCIVICNPCLLLNFVFLVLNSLFCIFLSFFILLINFTTFWVALAMHGFYTSLYIQSLSSPNKLGLFFANLLRTCFIAFCIRCQVHKPWYVSGITSRRALAIACGLDPWK
jgi:hypothetical protein